MIRPLSSVAGPATSCRHPARLRSTVLARFIRIAIQGLATSASLGSAAYAQTLPSGGTVAAGSAHIATGANRVTVTQSSQSAAINWQNFSIGKDNSVVFVQPNRNAVALNRVTGADPSVILGNLTANGKVFLLNANGIVFGKGANVNVGGLVASTLNISDADFMAGNYKFSGAGGSVLNQGTINADGGYVALLGATVNNEGLIQANLGTVALAAGRTITLDVAGDGLLNVAVDTGAVNALVQNGGLIHANGGAVLMTAQAAGRLLKTVVNNTGLIEAHAVQNKGGSIKLLGDMSSGTVTVGGILDASAAGGGDGGFIDTSAAHVNIADNASITTASPFGQNGTWLIDPQDFTVSANGNISGATLSAMLVNNSVVISTLTGPDSHDSGTTPPVDHLNTNVSGNGDIHVNEAIEWAAASNTTTLTFNATGDVNINAAITATNGNVVACCGRDVNINAAVTTTNGSILLSSARDVNLNAVGHNTVNPAMVGVLTVTDGNMMLCAGLNVLIAGKITLTNGASVASQSLGLDPGLKIVTGNNGAGPGVERGTLTFAPLSPPITVTNAAVQINYNPASYASPRNYFTNFILDGATLTQRMLVFPTADKTYDGTAGVILTGFASTATSGLPTGVTLVAGPNATAAFDSTDPGANIGITYSGYSLAGPDADLYALAEPCCGLPTRTTGTISPAPVDVPPIDVPPVDVPPVDVPPVDVPPVDVPPVDVPPVDVPPVDVPPVDVPPVDVPPVDVPPVDVPPVDVPPVDVPPDSGTIVGDIPPLAVLVPPALGIIVHDGGVRMPPHQVTSLNPPVVPRAEVIRPAAPMVVPPRIYPRKQDRN